MVVCSFQKVKGGLPDIAGLGVLALSVF